MERKVLVIAKKHTPRIDDLVNAIEGWLDQESFATVEVSFTTSDTVKKMLLNGYDKIVSVCLNPNSFSPKEVSAQIFKGGGKKCFVI